MLDKLAKLAKRASLVESKKKQKALIYVTMIIIFFLTIPELLFRTLNPEHLAWLGFMTSLGGMINPLLSVMIFMGILSIALAVATVYILSKIYNLVSRSAKE